MFILGVSCMCRSKHEQFVLLCSEYDVFYCMFRADFSVLMCTLHYIKVILYHSKRVVDRVIIEIRIFRQIFKKRKIFDNEFVLNRIRTKPYLNLVSTFINFLKNFIIYFKKTLILKQYHTNEVL